MNLEHSCESFQDAEAENGCIPVIYPDERWRPVGESMLESSLSLHPNGPDVWLYYPHAHRGRPAGSVVRYVNWSGCPNDLKTIQEEGASAWCPCCDPLPPKGK